VLAALLFNFRDGLEFREIARGNHQLRPALGQRSRQVPAVKPGSAGQHHDFVFEAELIKDVHGASWFCRLINPMGALLRRFMVKSGQPVFGVLPEANDIRPQVKCVVAFLFQD